ncbi:MAG TPA: S24 family peptidase [Nocardioidaceae bacterium]|nr:S24 family peptidase [Nocardioidaceae bacterium]
MAGDPMRRWGFAVVRGSSMLPTLHPGDRLLVRHGAVPREGAVVVCRLPDRAGPVVAVKRVVRREPGGWWVQADHQEAGVVDSWRVGAIPDTDLVAVVLARVWPRPRPFR